MRPPSIFEASKLSLRSLARIQEWKPIQDKVLQGKEGKGRKVSKAQTQSVRFRYNNVSEAGSAPSEFNIFSSSSVPFLGYHNYHISKFLVS